MFGRKSSSLIFYTILFLAIFITNGFSSEIRLTDILGREVTVPQEINRILAVGCSLREILSFEVADKIVAIEYREKAKTDEKGAPQGSELSYMLAFPELYDLPVVNVGVGGSEFNYEVIIGLNPDIIFLGASEPQKVENLQSKTGIPVLAVYTDATGTPKQDELYFKTLRFMGKVLGNEERAEELINDIITYNNDLTEKTKDISAEERTSVYIGGRAFYGSHGMTATDPQWPPFNLTNALNVAHELSDMSSGKNIDKEVLVAWDPEVIFLSPVSLSIIETELQSFPFKELRAVRDGKVHIVLPYCWYTYNKENALVDAYYVGKVIYPELFEDIDLDQKGVEIFKKFYGDSGEKAYYAIKERFNAFKEFN